MTSATQPGAITAEEAELVKTLRAQFPTDMESYGMIMDDAVLVRYLRARDLNVEKASAMLTATLNWRRDFGLPEVFSKKMDVIRKENATGKIYLSGFDSHGRPILVMRTRNENTHDFDGNLLHLVYQLERARAILQKTSGGLGKLCVMMDYVGFSLRNAPAMKISMATLNVMQNHYPETMGQAFFVSPPLVFKGFWKVIYPFIDKDTKEKFVFVSGSAQSAASQAILSKTFDTDELEEAFGGKYKTQFDSALYLGSPMDQDFRAVVAESSTSQAVAATLTS